MKYCAASFRNVPEEAAALKDISDILHVSCGRHSRETVLYVYCHNTIISERLQFRHSKENAGIFCH